MDKLQRKRSHDHDPTPHLECLDSDPETDPQPVKLKRNAAGPSEPRLGSSHSKSPITRSDILQLKCSLDELHVKMDRIIQAIDKLKPIVPTTIAIDHPAPPPGPLRFFARKEPY